MLANIKSTLDPQRNVNGTFQFSFFIRNSIFEAAFNLFPNVTVLLSDRVANNIVFES